MNCQLIRALWIIIQIGLFEWTINMLIRILIYLHESWRIKPTWHYQVHATLWKLIVIKLNKIINIRNCTIRAYFNSSSSLQILQSMRKTMIPRVTFKTASGESPSSQSKEKTPGPSWARISQRYRSWCLEWVQFVLTEVIPPRVKQNVVEVYDWGASREK